MEQKIYHNDDADLNFLKGKTIAVIGYGSQGNAQANCLRDSGVHVIIGVRENGESWNHAKKDGFEVYSISDAAAKADIVHLLVPDECHKQVYEQSIVQHIKQGKTLSCSHGFNILFKRITPPENVDVIMIAPKSPGTEERKAYLQGFGVPGLIAVEKDTSGNAKDTALAIAKGLGLTRAGILECTFGQEAIEDLFGEQTVLCGGIVELMKAGFDTLVEAGYPPEMAYFECINEVKLIVDLIYEGGFTKMYDVVSNTAEYGGMTVGPYLINSGVRRRMKKVLKKIENGKFAKEFSEECENGSPTLNKGMEEIKNSLVEKTGEKIRNLFEKKTKK